MVTNKLIWVITALLIGLAIVVVALQLSSDDTVHTIGADKLTEPAIPQVAVDGDTVQDTLKTLVSRLGEQEKELNELRELTRRARRDRNGVPDPDLQALQDRLQSLESELALVGTATPDQSTLPENLTLPTIAGTSPTKALDIVTDNFPVSDTFNDWAGTGNSISPTLAGGDGYVDILPLTGTANTVPAELVPGKADTGGEGDLYNSFARNTQGALRQRERRSEPVQPRYTIPMNATLYEANAMTAVIGRVPINGGVRDPFPVKVILGKENLAANGHRIPGLNGMVFAGKAVGDWNLSCVSVTLHSATYIWEDGRIQTVSEDALRSSGDFTDSDAEWDSGDGIGWLSTRTGVPCLPGKRISDAGTSSTLQVMLALAEGYTDAQARAQVTTTENPSGGFNSSITGDATRYYNNIAASTAINELGDILRERWRETFDAIFIEPGVQVAINIGRTLPVDYDPAGRQLAYSTGDKQYASGLD